MGTNLEAAPDLGPESSPGVSSNYFTGRLFLGTLLSLGLGMVSGTGSFALAAPILSNINADIGPNPNYTWVGLVNTLMMAVGYTVIGRTSDLCGRRYFVIGGNALGLIGSIICATAQSIPTLIGGSALLGLACSVQISPTFLLSELIPMRQRFLANGLMYFWVVPGSVFGPAISYGFLLHTNAGWRWVYYLLIITNGLATACWAIFYHPPTFAMLNKQTKIHMIKTFDYLGFVLFSGGLLVFLMGLSWGGAVYPWSSPYVIGSITCGGVALVCFAVYEHYAPVPLLPLRLFKNRDWLACSLVTALASSVFYAFSLIFPRMVFGVYTSDPTYGSILSCSVPGGFTAGVVFSGLSRYIGKHKWQVLISGIVGTPLVAAAACATTDNKSTILALLIPGSFFFGFVEGVSTTGTSLTLIDQSEIGVGVGVASTMRAAMGTISSTVYLAVLQNRQGQTIPKYVPTALETAGLAPSGIPEFMQNLESRAFGNIPGITPGIIEAGISAYNTASVMAFRTVFLTTLAFSGLTLFFSIWFPDLDRQMTDKVAVLLRDRGDRVGATDEAETKRESMSHIEDLQGETA